MERDSVSRKVPVLFPFLIEEPKPSHQDTMNRSFLTGVMSKWPDKQSRLIKNAFPPSKSVLSSHGSERTLKRFQNSSKKDIETKNYSCPNVVDMNNVIFYHGREMQHRPRRIINGFFPNKIRSAQGAGDGTRENRGRTPPQSQVRNGMYPRNLTKDLTNLPGLRGSHKPETTFVHGTKSTYYPEECSGVRRSQSCWQLRNGSPSPWLQRYKVKKRATTSFALQKPAQTCSEKEIADRTKRNQEYVNLSRAVIFDAF